MGQARGRTKARGRRSKGGSRGPLELNAEQLSQMYRKMLLIRGFEQKAIELFGRDLVWGTIHACIGQEATSVGVCSALREDDYIATTHRGHGDILAKGAEPGRMMAELLARDTGYNRGMGGSMHIADLSIGVLGANGIVGASILIGVGSALSSQMLKNDRVTVAFFGDGGANQGAFHEGLNLAAVWKLPAVFVCQNNLYSETTPYDETTSVRSIASRACAYGIPGIEVDGNDVEAVYEAATEAVECARSGGGPSLVECRTYRWEGHYYGDPQVYRSKEEVEDWKKRDPIPRLADRLLSAGVRQEVLDEIADDVTRNLEVAVAFAQDSPPADLAPVIAAIYGREVEP